MRFRDLLIESAISDIKKQEKVFLLVIGGSASGKNYQYNKNFKFPLVDLDDIVKGLQGKNAIKNAIVIANTEIEKHFKMGKSVAQVTTGAGAKGVENKFIKAKEFGFKTAMILVDTDVETSIKRNAARAASGVQNLVPDWKVEKSNVAARKTFTKLINMVDYSYTIRGN